MLDDLAFSCPDVTICRSSYKQMCPSLLSILPTDHSYPGIHRSLWMASWSPSVVSIVKEKDWLFCFNRLNNSEFR